MIETHLLISNKAFGKFRKSLNGDGTITYRVQTDMMVSITEQTLDKMKEFMRDSADDNRERPFFVIFDEEHRVALDVVVGLPGDENYCPHTPELVRSSERKMRELCEAASSSMSGELFLRISRGHTHPVFPKSSEGALATGMGMKLPQDVTFGAMPSNVWGDMMTWRNRRELAATEATGRAIDEILSKKLYKRNCEDYVESYIASHREGAMGGDPNNKASRFHWIITPRLGQIGVFEVPEDDYGVVVYYRWHVVDSAIPDDPQPELPSTHLLRTEKIP